MLKFIIKLLIDSDSYDPFAGETLEAEQTEISYKNQAVNSSRTQYARQVVEVDLELLAEDIEETLHYAYFFAEDQTVEFTS